MFNRLSYTIKQILYKKKGVDYPITHRPWKLEANRIDLANLLKEKRKEGDVGKSHARNILNNRKSSFEYRMAKYGTDKRGLLNLIEHTKLNKGDRKYWYDFCTFIYEHIDEYKGLDKEAAIVLIKNCYIESLFYKKIGMFKGLDKEVLLLLINHLHLWRTDELESFEKFEKVMFNKFSCYLDEEVAIELFKKIKHDPSCVAKFCKDLNKFSLDIEFIKSNYLDNYEGSLSKSEMIDFLIEKGCFDCISFDEDFIDYLSKNDYLKNENNLLYLKKILLDKKDIFDKNDANFVNELVEGGKGKMLKDWILKSILKFPDESLNYSVYKLFYAVGYDYERTEIDEIQFKKFKIYSRRTYYDPRPSYSYVCDAHTPEGVYNPTFEKLYFKNKFKEISFCQLLALFVDNRGRADLGVDGWRRYIGEGEIIEMLLSKEIKTGEEIKKDDIDKLFKRIDEETANKFVEKLKGVHLT